MKTQITIPVLGCWSGGTSLVAGILQKLGVSMGESFFWIPDLRTLCTYESVSLRQILCQYFSQESLHPIQSLSSLEQDLQHWVQHRRQQHSILGGKHPLLCLCVPQWQRAWGPDLKPIALCVGP